MSSLNGNINRIASDGSCRLVVVDVDTGTDDAVATFLLLAADAAREIKLLGITCVSGNSTLENAWKNTLRVLKAANRLDIPVFAGADGPLIGERIHADYHGSDGFGDIADKEDLTDTHKLLQKENAVVAMNRLVMENKGQVTLVCLAPLTNIALAMRTFPEFSKSVKEIHIMGGNVKGLGNITPTAEFNFYADPESAHIVLECAACPCPVQITPWETCADHPISLDWRCDVLGKLKNAPVDLLNSAERNILTRLHGWGREWIACDQFTVTALLRPELVLRTHRRHASVELAGKTTRGQMVPMSIGESKTPNVVVVDEFDTEGVKKFMLWAVSMWTKE